MKNDICIDTLVPTLISVFPKRLSGVSTRLLLEKMESIGIKEGCFTLMSGTAGDVTFTFDDLRKSNYYLTLRARDIQPIRFIAGPSTSYKGITGSFLHYGLDRLVERLVYIFKHEDIARYIDAFTKVLRLDEYYPYPLDSKAIV